MRVPDYPAADAQEWSAVDGYFADMLAPSDADLNAALAANADAGLPVQDVTATQGKMLALFIKMAKASRVLEIGTLGGYSTIWMARALPADGRIVTIEAKEQHAKIAHANIARAGLADRVDIRVGAALDVLPSLEGPFDLIFIDADKPNNPYYLQWALRLAKPGTVIVLDNVVRGGAVIDAASEDATIRGVRECLRMMAEEPRLSSTAIQTVGEKGWDGFALAIVEAK
ncbi:O-methyltransferase [Methylovirgula sp. 4M-Z18]|uniref:O-methyltransferase n=1 Tax=Methylovirgula sp. 4M-Z18 TaxID=2293567 RepID=UPI000E2F42E5|nr:O-methyltransferase [Methylovirgula sp. 4M-Z18]RFB75026.1 O-methyltransferase [Methylovirgula sp. 4M-Z18]